MVFVKSLQRENEITSSGGESPAAVEGQCGQSQGAAAAATPPQSPRGTRRGGRRENNELHRPAYLIAA